MATKKTTLSSKKTAKKVTKKVAKKATKKVAPKKAVKPKAKPKAKKAVVVDKNVRKVQRQANGSTTIVLPAELLRELKWKPKMNVTVKKRGEGILIEKVKKK